MRLMHPPPSLAGSPLMMDAICGRFPSRRRMAAKHASTFSSKLARNTEINHGGVMRHK